MWRAILIIALAVVYIYFNQPELFPELNILINKLLKPGKRGNLFPPLSKTKPSTIPGEPDNDFGPGWIGSAGAFRLLSASITTYTPNPSGDMFYFALALCDDVVCAIVNNLVVGRTYQLSVYVLGADNQYQAENFTFVISTKLPVYVITK